MSVTRKNHYVPQWHQERFFSPGKTTHCLLDMDPETYPRKDGTIAVGRTNFDAPTSRAFVEEDLYSTFFGPLVNDEIERQLFGDIDRRGANAITAFSADDQGEWHDHFMDLFDFLDIQKLRTPKGLAWLRQQFPEIDRVHKVLPGIAQNQLMEEMQSIRQLNITTWTTGVREIVSAERSATKFIVSDHPITVYNHAIPPTDPRNSYPNDPSTALKGSQTIYPLGPDHCLILTNLEYAKDPYVDAVAKRTFARSFRNTMVSTIEFIKSRHLTEDQVEDVNYVIKARARRYIAGGKREWLNPHKVVTKSWADLRTTFLPPSNELYRFGGEMFASYNDGHVHYQDEFGRTEKPRPWLVKAEPKAPPKPRDYCPCGSGHSFGNCCSQRPERLRTSWTEKSIRERNMMLMNGVTRLFDMENVDWDNLRREMTDEKIAKLYGMHETLWPLETDLLSLLPRPDGKLRSVYTGALHPKLILEFALSSPLYFGEVIIQHPFVNAGTIAKDLRPTDHPSKYRGEVLKALMTFLQIMPLVEAGLVTPIPDPCDFDYHLRDQMFAMARARARSIHIDASDDPRMHEVVKEDMHRMMLNMPREVLATRMAKIAEQDGDSPIGMNAIVDAIEHMKSDDMLAVLQDDSLKNGGQFELMKMAPNFEIAMYLAQATGAQILTDSPFRWQELQAALNRRYLGTETALLPLQAAVHSSPMQFPVGHDAILRVSDDPAFAGIRSVLQSAYNYTNGRASEDLKPNFESQLAARFLRHKKSVDVVLEKGGVSRTKAKLTSMFRLGGFQDNTVNRLLLMSSSQFHLPTVPMATYIERAST